MARKSAAWTWLIASIISAQASAAPILGFGNASGTTPIYVGQASSVEVPLFLTLDATTDIAAIFANIQVGLLDSATEPWAPVAGTPVISNTPTIATLTDGTNSIQLIGQSLSLAEIETNQFGIGGAVSAVPTIPAGTYSIGSIDLDTTGATPDDYTLSLVDAGITNGRGNLLESEIFGSTGSAALAGVTFESRDLRVVELGDMNYDGAVNNFDISPFVLALTNPTTYVTQYPTAFGFESVGDINADGALNNFDITPFVQLLTPGAGTRVPEPSAFTLVATYLSFFPSLCGRTRRNAKT